MDFKRRYDTCKTPLKIIKLAKMPFVVRKLKGPKIRGPLAILVLSDDGNNHKG